MMGVARQLMLFALLVLVFHETIIQTNAECPADMVKFKEFAPDHTACAAGSDFKNTADSRGGMTQAIKDEIVDYHNKIRAEVSPLAIDMLKMSWDDEVAMLADKWVKQCRPGGKSHDKNYQRYIPNRFSVGQNMAGRGDTTLEWTPAMKLWADEKPFFEYGKGHAAGHEGKVFAHYTQMIWGHSHKIGCAHALCPDGLTYFICNYAPSGNIAGGNNAVTPYASGTEKGSKCKTKTTKSGEAGLCDCGDMECDNWGKMDVAKCECVCGDQPWFKNQEKCSINCTLISQEPSMCAMWGFQDCLDYANWPMQCPQTCKQCAAGTSAVTATTGAQASTDVRTTGATQAATASTAAPAPAAFNTILTRRFPTTCYITDDGRDYNGTISITTGGRTCQRWNMRAPHYHGFQTEHFVDYKVSLAKVENYCRNTQKKGAENMPWCYTTDTSKRWELCTIPKCTKDCKSSANGHEYAGTLTTTRTGKTCKHWKDVSDWPENAPFMPELNKEDAKNYCRNPDQSWSTGLWCYVEGGTTAKAWDYCDIPSC